MRVGKLVSMPNDYTNFARVKDKITGEIHTVDPGELPKDSEEGNDFAYKVEIWSNGSGLAHSFVEDD